MDILGADKVLDTPDVLLIDSSTSERGHRDVCVSNISRSTVGPCRGLLYGLPRILTAAQERHLPYPRKICVMDRAAKELIVKHFPELEERIEVTGQPAFDRFAAEDTERMKTEVRKELGLAPDEKLIAFMGAQGELELLEKMANELKKLK